MTRPDVASEKSHLEKGSRTEKDAMKKTYSIAMIALLAAKSVVVTHGQRRSDFIEDFLEDFLAWKMEASPESSSLDGFHEFDSALTDTSPESAARAKERCVEFSGKANAILNVSLNHGSPILSHCYC